MKLNQVAAQLYTIRDFLKTPTDIRNSLQRIRSIGYQAVQLSGLGPIEVDELKRILVSEGLVCCATHEPSDKILAEPEAVAARLNSLGCKHTAYPYPGGFDFSSRTSVLDLAAKLDHAGKVLREAGCVLSYHNHHIEFRRLGAKTAMEVILKAASRENLQMEMDTYWVQYGGCSPVEWCRKLKGRLPLLHMKDYAINKDNQIVFAEIGSGNLPWKKLIAAAEKAGCEWFIVEQDTCPGDPFDSLKTSFDYIRDRLVSG